MNKPIVVVKNQDFLKENLRMLPYFRALLRAVESRFYTGTNLNNPVLDLGCGDGLFAQTTFSKIQLFGIDPNFNLLVESQKTGSYLALSLSEGSWLPFRNGAFAGCFSNSVLEHIPDIDPVLPEISRVLKSGSIFTFCVPNASFTKNLSIGRFLDHIHMTGMARIYRGFFNKISRHYHCDPFEVWQKRLDAAGFIIVDHWDYFSPAALQCLEWGHYLGIPYWFSKKIFGKWVIWPDFNQGLIYNLVKRFYREEPKQKDGAYSFYIARKQ